MMIIVPIEENTLDIIAAMNNGVKPKIDPLEHSCFIYHGEDKLTELVPTVYVGTLAHGKVLDTIEVNIAIIRDDVQEPVEGEDSPE